MQKPMTIFSGVLKMADKYPNLEIWDPHISPGDRQLLEKSYHASRAAYEAKQALASQKTQAYLRYIWEPKRQPFFYSPTSALSGPNSPFVWRKYGDIRPVPEDVCNYLLHHHPDRFERLTFKDLPQEMKDYINEQIGLALPASERDRVKLRSSEKHSYRDYAAKIDYDWTFPGQILSVPKHVADVLVGNVSYPDRFTIVEESDG